MSRPFERLRRLFGADAPDPPAGPLAEIVAAHMPEATPEARRIVGAVAGLLAAVAFADHVYDPDEGARIREILARFEELAPEGVTAVAALLAKDLAAVAIASHQRWLRDLRELADREQRLEVLGVLVDLAASDGEIAHEEANLLRRITDALGLGQDDYLALQDRYRDRLQVL